MSHAVAVKASTTIHNPEILCLAAERVVAADNLRSQIKGSVKRFATPTAVNIGYGNIVQSLVDIEMVRGSRTFHVALQANKDKTYSLVYDHMNPEEAVREVGVVYDMMVQAQAAESLEYAATSFARDEQGEWACQLEKI
ncbi:MAG TPA: hypothetical protein VNV15_06390 [Opitutaceae bacterium]|jgi:hypothetical protein|nr:hypothetical protein [Opitutaceae bacterium]